MESCPNSYQHCAMVEKGGKCCGSQAKEGCVMSYLFAGLVLAGLIVIIVMQAKTFKLLRKHAKSK